MNRVINAIHRASRATVTMFYNCRLLDEKVRRMRGVDLGMGAWCCFRDLAVNQSNTREYLILLDWWFEFQPADILLKI
jgi:hypothetical protein